jgi:2-polyprenyl-3-methyl-5-hydroxy-6-metoxy-1,4-benzoquinol methylase
MRNHNLEYQDNQGRKYAYDFDTIIRRYLLNTLEPHFAREGSVLELGCYKGDMTAQILEYFPSVTAIEAASDLADAVRARFADRVTVLVSTFEDVELDRRYDNIFLVHTLEHVDHPVEALTRIRQWLSPTGRLFVAVPNANALSRQIAVRMGLIEYNAAVTPAEAQHGHRCTYSMDVLLSQLQRAGYRLDDYGGVIVKPLANFQFDQAIAAGIVGEAYVAACHELAKIYPDLSASLYAVCSSPASS